MIFIKLILNIASNSDFDIEVFESDVDHIHFLIRYIPKISITSIVRKLKQESTYHIWRSCHRPLFSQTLLERAYSMVGWLFCMLCW